jgi:hypothetical protein
MAGHGEPEGSNNIAPASISERTLREVSLQPFRYTVKKPGVRNIIANYNEVNETPGQRRNAGPGDKTKTAEYGQRAGCNPLNRRPVLIMTFVPCTFWECTLPVLAIP